MTDSWRDGIWLKLLNINVYSLLLVSNLSTVVIPEDPYTHGKLTYITPSPWAFLVWSWIHFLLLGTLLYQFTPEGKSVVIDKISWRFPLLGALSVLYVNFRAWDLYLHALVFALLVSITVTNIYYVVKESHSSPSLANELFVHILFSLYHSWTTVLVVLAIFEAFDKSAEYPFLHPGAWTPPFVYFAIFLLEAVGAAYAFSEPEGDLPATITITWSLFAIVDKQRARISLWPALALAFLSLIWVFKSAFDLVNKWPRRAIVLEDTEHGNVPLVP